MKRCKKCDADKDEKEFNKDKRYADKLFPWCKACMREYRTGWEQEHKDERTEYFKQWHIENIDRRHERNNQLTRDKYHANPEYREKKNKQKSEQRKKKYGIDLEWTRRVLAWGNAHHRRRRNAELSAEGSHTEEEWQALCQRFDYRCVACGNQDPLTRDHVVPITKGGTDYIENIQPLCQLCNSKKHTKTIDYRK